MKWKNKYKPTAWTHLMMPANPNARNVLKKLFQTGKCASAGILLYDSQSNGGTGKTTCIEMLVEHLGRSTIYLKPSGNKVGELEELRSNLEGRYGASNGLFDKIPEKTVVVCHEISKSPKNYIDGLRDIMDKYDEDVLFLFTDNNFALLQEHHPQMFLQQRCISMDYDTVPKEEIRNYCMNILDAEGKRTYENEAIVDALISTHLSSIRGIIVGMENNCK